MRKNEMKKVIVGCEPMGCYWLTFQKFLQEHNIQLVTVNPFTVNRSMELDDNSSEKSDLKDPETMASLVKDGRFSTTHLPSGVYAEIRGLCLQRSDYETACTSVKPDSGMASKILPRIF